MTEELNLVTLKHRIMLLESVVRRQDKLLRAVCKSLSTFNLDPKLKKEADDYLKVFENS